MAAMVEVAGTSLYQDRCSGLQTACLKVFSASACWGCFVHLFGVLHARTGCTAGCCTAGCMAAGALSICPAGAALGCTGCSAALMPSSTPTDCCRWTPPLQALSQLCISQTGTPVPNHSWLRNLTIIVMLQRPWWWRWRPWLRGPGWRRWIRPGRRWRIWWRLLSSSPFTPPAACSAGLVGQQAVCKRG